MDIFHIIVLALIQGLTEFLPISSSGHLILPKELLGWPDQGLAFDVAVHVGTLLAVMLYFRRDIVTLILAWGQSIVDRRATDDGRLAWYIIIATIPAGLFGLLFDDFIETHLREVEVIATTTIIFGLALAFADRRASEGKALAQMTLTIAILIGVSQALAMVPGTSRSGITITAALLFGFSRVDAARFSFLLSIPVIVLSGGYLSLGLLDEPSVDWISLGIGAAVSAVSAYICIYYFLNFISRIGMMPFVVYRLLLGLLLFGVVLV
ncbi:MAG: undecaprenyl-diphosphatase [Alteromonadaceae bacterium]|nr:MAG: undecaprenyl-diphosphatase [Alteromonadaceae bacterium]